MKTIINIEDCNKKLSEFKGASIQIWSFNITHKRLLLRLWMWSESEHKIEDEIFISALGCEHITGPFSWKNSYISIEKESNKETTETEYRIKDKNSDFQLIATAGVALIEEPEESVSI